MRLFVLCLIRLSPLFAPSAEDQEGEARRTEQKTIRHKDGDRSDESARAAE